MDALLKDVKAQYGVTRRNPAGFHGMVRALIQDKSGVRINILSGAVDTPSLRRALGEAAGSEAVRPNRSVDGAEGARSGGLERRARIGEVAVFFASDASSYVNGVELFVDGGLTQVA